MLKLKVTDVIRASFALLARTLTAVKSFILLLVVALHLSACASDPSPSENSTSKLDSSPAELNSDSLQPPAQPELLITAAPETLVFTWQTDSRDQTANLYAYNPSLNEEILIQGNMGSETTSITIESKSARRIWNNEQFRVELCDPLGCVSSAKVPLTGLLANTTATIRPSEFIESERFAEHITTNHDASVIFATLPVRGAIQVYFHIEGRWIAASPIGLDNLASASIDSIVSSESGDTLAALMVSDTAQPTIRIIERLGENWFTTSTLSAPELANVDPSRKITLSDNGDALLLHTADNVLLFRRNQLAWNIETPVSVTQNATIKAVTVNSQLNIVHVVTLENGQLWLSSHEHESTWKNVGRRLIQGVNAHNEVSLHSNSEGSSIIVAGWDTVSIDQRSPVMWRLNTSQDSENSQTTDVQIIDSISAPPTTDVMASLRFSASDDLNTVALGWQSLTSESAELSTYTYLVNERQWHSALELPHQLTPLAKQAFAQTVLLSPDGKTLIMTTPVSNGSAPSNRVGELRVFH